MRVEPGTPGSTLFFSSTRRYSGKMKDQHGMTLLELMIVVAILAVVAGIAIPMYSGYLSSAHRTECRNEVAAIELAEQEFFLDNSRYFNGADIAALEANSGGIYVSSYTTADAATTAANIANAQCSYAVAWGTSGDNQSYQITATGQNKLPAETIAQKGK